MARKFSADQRRSLAKKGAAMGDGSFPIEDETDLKAAISAVGRASDTPAAKRHIVRRARALGLVRLLPDDWTVSASDVAISDAVVALGGRR